MLHSKKVGTLPVKGSDKEKQTNEIKTVIPLLDCLNIQGKTITGDALLTQRFLADHIVVEKNAHYHFTVKGNQKTLRDDIKYYFDNINRKADHSTIDGVDHGRIETREIWVTAELNEYLNFPCVGQAFMVKRHTINKKTDKESCDIAYGVTSKSPDLADAIQVLNDNRGHWTIENKTHYIIDWNYDEDRSRIRTGYGPENVTRLRRFAISLLLMKKSKNCSIAQKMQRLNRNTRAVFDYLKMTRNSCGITGT